MARHLYSAIYYFEDLWMIENYSSELLDALTAKDCLIVLKHGLPPYSVLIGVPHQAAIGAEHIAELRSHSASGKRASDENAAFYALVTFSTLRDRDIPCPGLAGCPGRRTPVPGAARGD